MVAGGLERMDEFGRQRVGRRRLDRFVEQFEERGVGLRGRRARRAGRPGRPSPARTRPPARSRRGRRTRPPRGRRPAAVPAKVWSATTRSGRGSTKSHSSAAALESSASRLSPSVTVATPSIHQIRRPRSSIGADCVALQHVAAGCRRDRRQARDAVRAATPDARLRTRVVHRRVRLRARACTPRRSRRRCARDRCARGDRRRPNRRSTAAAAAA